MIKLWFFAAVILIMSGCSTSNLDYDNRQLTVELDKEYLHVDGTLIKRQDDNFKTLFLTKKLIRLKNGSMLMYEYAKTDMQYQFEHSTVQSIKIIFDAKSITSVYYGSHLYAFQLILKDNRVLNVLVSQMYDQELKMLYGMSTEQLDKMLKKLDPNALPAYYRDVIDLSKEHEPLMSNWTTRKVHFAPLVVPLRQFGTL